MVNQPIIKTAKSSVKTFEDNKNKFEVWIASVENATQISGQDILQKEFSKKVGSPFTSFNRLRDRSPNLECGELKSKLSRQYSSTTFNSHAIQAFACLQQGLGELLEMKLHHANELL